MKFNPIKRGANRQKNEEQALYEVLDAGFLCHVAFTHGGMAHQIPTTYGRENHCLYLHGSSKNFMLNQLLNGQKVCISVTHLDGVVLAQTLFNTSANYRSAIVYGTAELVCEQSERMHALKVITEHIIPGRWDEVPLGSASEIKATLVVKIPIESASVKMRAGGPQGDEKDNSHVWSGHIPLNLTASEAIFDRKFGESHSPTESVKAFRQKFK